MLLVNKLLNLKKIAHIKMLKSKTGFCVLLSHRHPYFCFTLFYCCLNFQNRWFKCAALNILIIIPGSDPDLREYSPNSSSSPGSSALGTSSSDSPSAAQEDTEVSSREPILGVHQRNNRENEIKREITSPETETEILMMYHQKQKFSQDVTMI